jgi:hypothetical protein
MRKATITKNGEMRTDGSTFCEQCGNGLPASAPFAVEVIDKYGAKRYVHGRCKVAWDEANPTDDPQLTQQHINPGKGINKDGDDILRDPENADPCPMEDTREKLL